MKGRVCMARITNTAELVSAIQDISTPVETPDVSISTKMNAAEINTLFNSIEDCFDKLYEKLRLLEDLHDFAEQYIQNEFSKTKKEVDDAILKLDTASELYTDTSVKAETVSFSSGSVIYDRDNRPISNAGIVNSNTIIAGSVNMYDAAPVSVFVKSNMTAYRRNKLPADNYKTFYVSETLFEKPVTETIEFIFSQPVKINYIDASAMNASVKNISVLNSARDIKQVYNDSILCDESMASGIRIELESSVSDSVNVNVTEPKDTFSNIETSYSNSVLDTLFEQSVKNGEKITNVS